MAVHALAGGAAGPSARRWAAFAAIAGAIALADQVTKAMVTAAVPLGQMQPLAGDLLRIAPAANTGALFGLFRDQALLFGALSLVVLGLIVFYHARSAAAAGPLLTVALGLLLGGAIGNLIDRFRFGYVLDFVDMGVGGLRWYTYNVADAAITASILVLLLMTLLGERLPGAGRGRG